MPEEFICGDWVWDPVLREMRHYPRLKKGHASEPDAVERLTAARRVRLYRWSQQPMQTATGHVMPASQARVEVEYEDGRKLEINEFDRGCAEKIAEAIAGAYGMAIDYQGAPTGRHSGNLPKRDQMGRLVNNTGREDVVLDDTGGLIEITRRKRPFGKDRRTYRTSEIRRLELAYDIRGPEETFTVYALLGPEEEKVPVARYTGLEGWADAAEWRDFTEELARRIGVEARLP